MRFLLAAFLAAFAFSAHAVEIPQSKLDALNLSVQDLNEKMRDLTAAPVPVPTPLPSAVMPAPGTYAHGYFINNDGVYDFAGISLSNTVQHYTTESIAAGFPRYNGWGYDDKATVLVDGSIGLGAQKQVNATIRNFKSTADRRSTYDTQAAIRIDGLGSVTIEDCDLSLIDHGILVGNIDTTSVTVRRCNLHDLGRYSTDGQTHAIYAGRSAEIVFEDNIVGPVIGEGHLFKSRAAKGTIARSKFNGGAVESRTLDISIGGDYTFADLLLTKSVDSANNDIIGWAYELPLWPTQRIALAGTVVAWNRSARTAVFIGGRATNPVPVFDTSKLIKLVFVGNIVPGMLPAAVPITRLSESQAAAQGLIPLVVTPPTPTPEPTPTPVPEPVPPLLGGTWSELPNTDISQVVPKLADVGSLVWGVEGPSAIVYDWTSAAFDHATKTIHINHQGGHGGYGGNEDYRLKLFSGQGWVRWSDPSKLTPTPPFYPNADNRPLSAHGWGGVVWVPSIKAVFSATRSLYPSGDGIQEWLTYPETKTYERMMRPYRTDPLDTTKPAQPYYNPDSLHAIYDPVRNIVLNFRYNDEKFDPLTKQVTVLPMHSGDTGNFWSGAAAYDPTSKFAVYASGGAALVVVDTRDLNKMKRTAYGFAKLGVPADQGLSAPGIDFLPKIGSFVMWAGGRRTYLIKLDANGVPTLTVLANADGPEPPKGSGKIYGKFRCMDDIQKCWALDWYPGNVFMWSLPSP